MGLHPMDQLTQDEMMMNIGGELASGVQPQIFVQDLKLLRDASMTTNVNERAHGFGARLCQTHGQYGYELVAGRSALNACFPLFEGSDVQKRVDMLCERCAGLDRRKPPRTPSIALHFQAVAQERLSEGFAEGHAPFNELQSAMGNAAKRWQGIGGAGEAAVLRRQASACRPHVPHHFGEAQGIP